LTFAPPKLPTQEHRLDGDAYDRLELPAPIGPYFHTVTRQEAEWFIEATAVPGMIQERLRKELSEGFVPQLVLANDFSCAFHTKYSRSDIIPAGARYEILAPLRIDATVRVSGNIVSRIEKGPRRFLLIETEAVDVASNTVVMRSRDFSILWPH
jgi:hypothetical protein